VESQILKKTTFNNTHNDDFYNLHRRIKTKFLQKLILSISQKNPLLTIELLKKNLPPLPTKTSSRKCLGFGHISANCPMLVKWEAVMSEHSSQSSRSSSPTYSKIQSEEEYEMPCEGDLLVVRLMFGQLQKPFNESQRENIFHTRCLINGKLCSLIVVGSSFTNVASTRVVKKLGLPTIS